MLVSTPSHGIVYFPQFVSHQETKMAARGTQRLESTISQKNRGTVSVLSRKKKIVIAHSNSFIDHKSVRSRCLDTGLAYFLRKRVHKITWPMSSCLELTIGK